LEYNSEAVIERHVINYIEDLVTGLGLKYVVKVFQGIQVLSLKPDLWMLTANNTPFLILEVKKPGHCILSNKKVLAQARQYMLMMRNYHNVQDVFGIVTTLEEFRVTWLPDCDAVAASTEYIGGVHEVKYDENLHGTKVLQTVDASFHHYIASVILKAFRAAQHIAARGPLRKRTVFMVDKSSLTWSTMREVADFTFESSAIDVQSFFLLSDLHCGTYGRAWLAASNTKPGHLLVLKLGEVTQFNTASAFHVEQSYWERLGFYSRTVLLQNCEALIMPFAITCKSPAEGKVEWDKRAWEELAEVVSEESKELIITALSISPEKALPHAIAFMSGYGVWHKDMEWRHLCIIPFVPQSESGKGLCVVYSFIDLGQMEFITESNRVEAESSMAAARDRLISELQH
jgi:hypothetical protein